MSRPAYEPPALYRQTNLSGRLRMAKTFTSLVDCFEFLAVVDREESRLRFESHNYSVDQIEAAKNQRRRSSKRSLFDTDEFLAEMGSDRIENDIERTRNQPGIVQWTHHRVRLPRTRDAIGEQHT